MIGKLDEATMALLKSALPGLLGGASPAVTLTLLVGTLDIDPQPADGPNGEPRPADRSDTLPLDPAKPEGPYSLTQPPYPGPKRVMLVADDGARLALQSSEVIWDRTDSKVFRLALQRHHQKPYYTGIQVLYAVSAIFTRLKARQQLTVQLACGDAARLKAAEALVLSVLELNRQALIDGSAATYEEGDYSGAVTIKGLKFVQGLAPADTQRQLIYQADLELRCARALDETEGVPIERIRVRGAVQDTGGDANLEIN